MGIQFNPNGSSLSREYFSPDGRILGKMGRHPKELERAYTRTYQELS